MLGREGHHFRLDQFHLIGALTKKSWIQCARLNNQNRCQFLARLSETESQWLPVHVKFSGHIFLDGMYTLSYLISKDTGVLRRISLRIMKDYHITQEIPRLFGALCQEPGKKNKYIFLNISHIRTPMFIAQYLQLPRYGSNLSVYQQMNG